QGVALKEVDAGLDAAGAFVRADDVEAALAQIFDAAGLAAVSVDHVGVVLDDLAHEGRQLVHGDAAARFLGEVYLLALLVDEQLDDERRGRSETEVHAIAWRHLVGVDVDAADPDVRKNLGLLAEIVGTFPDVVEAI